MPQFKLKLHFCILPEDGTKISWLCNNIKVPEHRRNCRNRSNPIFGTYYRKTPTKRRADDIASGTSDSMSVSLCPHRSSKTHIRRVKSEKLTQGMLTCLLYLRVPAPEYLVDREAPWSKDHISLEFYIACARGDLVKMCAVSLKTRDIHIRTFNTASRKWSIGFKSMLYVIL